jgi:hypothetical protein
LIKLKIASLRGRGSRIGIGWYGLRDLLHLVKYAMIL